MTVVRFEVTSVEEIGGLQYVSGRGMAGESIVQALRMEAHGSAGHPPVGSIGIAIFMGGNRSMPVMIGGEHPSFRPSVPAGAQVLYNQFGQAIRIYQDDVTIEAGAKCQINADEIILNGTCRLGSVSASTPASMLGTLDTGGFQDVSGTATKVFVT